MAIPVSDYPKYLIDEYGKVYSTISKKYLKPATTKQGYKSVELFNDKGSRRMLIHRLVATAYIPNPNNYEQVNHIDENPSNNSVGNLEWCTAKYNMNYGNGAKTRHLKIDYTKPIYKENAIKNGKLASVSVIQIDLSGNILNKFDSIRDAEKYLGVKKSHICHCCKGHRKTANGFIWRYERGNDLSLFQF